MSTILAALKAIWDFLWGAIADFFNWVRKPGGKLKLVCAILAFFLAIAAMKAWQAEQAIVTLTLQCETDKGTLTRSIADRDATLLEVKANAAAERAAKNEQILRAEAARKEAERKARAAEASLKAFEAEYEQKPPACTAALTALKAACPTLRDY